MGVKSSKPHAESVSKNKIENYLNELNYKNLKFETSNNELQKEIAELESPISNLIQAIKLGDISTFNDILTRDIDINSVNFQGRTALHIACLEGNLYFITRLLEIPGIDINKTDPFGFTPLMAAASIIDQGSKSVIINHLISKGADVTITLSGTSMTAAHYFMLVESIHNDYWFENPVFKDLLAKAGISNPLQVLDETQWPGLRGVNTLRMGENPIFTLVGHGYENLNRFEDRETIKPGRILIVSTKCGMYSFFNNEVKKAIEYAAVDSDEKNVLFNKLFSEDKVQSYAALKSIETAMDISGLRMYRSGDKYPSIMFELDEVIKSGLFLNPIKKEDFLITGGIHGNYAKPESDESYFANAVYPTHDGVEWSKKILTPIVGSGQSIIKKAIDLQIFRISLSTLMDTYGPGVYIFPGCRDIKELQTDRKKIQEAGIFHKNIVKESRQYYNRTRTGIVNDETRKFLSILKPQIKQIILTRQLSNLQQKTIHGIKNATPAGGAGVSTRRTHKRGRRTRRKQRIGFK